MKALLLLVVAAGLTACGDDAPNSDRDKRLIRECGERGGHAAFSTDQYGNAYFITCEEKP